MKHLFVLFLLFFSNPAFSASIENVNFVFGGGEPYPIVCGATHVEYGYQFSTTWDNYESLKNFLLSCEGVTGSYFSDPYIGESYFEMAVFWDVEQTLQVTWSSSAFPPEVICENGTVSEMQLCQSEPTDPTDPQISADAFDWGFRLILFFFAVGFICRSVYSAVRTL